jgi:hypothetical protein
MVERRRYNVRSFIYVVILLSLIMSVHPLRPKELDGFVALKIMAIEDKTIKN